MTDETKKRILAALETSYGNAHDNAVRARAQEQRGYSAAEGALFREYAREEAAALAALKEFDPSWSPRRAFSG